MICAQLFVPLICWSDDELIQNFRSLDKVVLAFTESALSSNLTSFDVAGIAKVMPISDILRDDGDIIR